MSDVSRHGIERLLRPRTVARKCHPCPRTVLLPLSQDRTLRTANTPLTRVAKWGSFACACKPLATTNGQTVNNRVHSRPPEGTVTRTTLEKGQRHSVS